MTSPSPVGEPNLVSELARFRDEFRLPESNPGDRLDALGFDSLGFLELLVYVEGRSGRMLDEATFATLATVGDVLGCIGGS